MRRIPAVESLPKGPNALRVRCVIHVSSNDDLLTTEALEHGDQLGRLSLSDVGVGRLGLQVGANDHEVAASGLVAQLETHPVLAHLVAVFLQVVLAVDLDNVELGGVRKNGAAASERVRLVAVVSNPVDVLQEERGVLVALSRANYVPEGRSVLALLVEFLLEQRPSVLPGEMPLVRFVKAIGQLLCKHVPVQHPHREAPVLARVL